MSLINKFKTSCVLLLATSAFSTLSMSGADQPPPLDPKADHKSHQATNDPDSKSLPLLGSFSSLVPPNAQLVKVSQEIMVKDGGYITLTASIVKQRIGNKIIKRLAYNGSIPGPQIKVAQGSTIKLKLVNNTDTDTTLHSHGVRLNFNFDGVPGVGQPAIKPGESFEYTLTFPDPGLYWYHPHIREDYAQELGLYGTYNVTPKDAQYYNQVDSEQNIVLDDINLNAAGLMPEFPLNDTNYALMGRFGNIMLANNDPDYTVTAQKSDVIRFFLTNAANTRTFRLRSPGIKIKKVGGDMGLYEKEAMVDEIILAPAERSIFEAYFSEQGNFIFQHVGSTKPVTIFKVNVKGGPSPGKFHSDFLKLRTIAPIASEMASVRKVYNKPPHHSIALSIDLPKAMADDMKHMNHGKPGPIEWDDPMESMNSAARSSAVKWNVIDIDTGKRNMAINWLFKKGELIKIRIFNDPNSPHPMQHPIHFHGQRFAVLAEDGVINQNMVWKDTVLVKTGSTVDIAVEASNVGDWMSHCHIAEHLSSGMMFGFKVIEQTRD